MNSLPLIFFLALVGTSALYSAETFLPGLVMELRGHSSDSPDFRLERRAALRVDLGEPPSAFLDLGPFEAVWRGVLCLDKRERLYFSFEGFGMATLLIGGEFVLEAKAENLALVESPRLRLNGGQHQLELRYSSSPMGTGRIRLFWRGRDFARESIPPKSLKHPLGGTHYESLLKSTKLRKGRFLAAVSGCLGCHVPDKALESKTAMPEAFAKGPSLRGVGSRLNELWMAKWILDPHAISPLARMPKLVSSPEESAHLAAFLASLKEEAAEPKAFLGNSKAGKSLFVELGCIVCHRLKEDEESSESKRIILVGLHQKYLPGALRKFLLKPGKHYLWTRMPDFQLTVKEATDLASFLRGLAAPPG